MKRNNMFAGSVSCFKQSYAQGWILRFPRRAGTVKDRRMQDTKDITLRRNIKEKAAKGSLGIQIYCGEAIIPAFATGVI